MSTRDAVEASSASVRTRFGLSERSLALTVVCVAAVAWAILTWSHVEGFGHHMSQPVESPGSAATPGQLSLPPPPLGIAHRHGAAATAAGGKLVENTGNGPDTPGPGSDLDVAALGVLIGGWAVMVVAMMLPPALPMLQMLRRLVGRRSHPRLLMTLGAFGFIGVWVVVGAALVGNDAALRALSDRSDWLSEHQYVIAGIVLIGAGTYQFTRLKNSCLRACRTPRGFAIAHWRGQRPAAVEMLTVTSAYALSCVGCCWALMAVSVVVSAAAELVVMIVMSLVMAAERLASWGARLARPAGVAIAAVGVLALIGWPAGILA